MQRLEKSIPNQVLNFLKSFYPKVDRGVIVVVDGVATDYSDEKFQKLMQETAPIAERVAQCLKLQ